MTAKSGLVAIAAARFPYKTAFAANVRETLAINNSSARLKGLLQQPLCTA